MKLNNFGASDGLAEWSAEFSTDGRWIAFVDGPDIFVRPSHFGPGGKILVSTGGGRWPEWSKDGKRIYYLAGRRIMEVECRTNGDTFVGGKPRPWSSEVEELPSSLGNFQMAADGSRVAYVRNPNDSSDEHLVILLNFCDELQRRVPR